MKITKCNFKMGQSLIVKEETLNYEIHQEKIDSNLRSIKKDYGIFFTPQWVVDFMVNLINDEKLVMKKNVSILEPACGLAQFLMGIKRNYPSLFKIAKLTGIELNADIVNYLRTFNICKNFELVRDDYLLWEPQTSFDLIIGNPPYGIPSLSDHYTVKVEPSVKKKYKMLYQTWYGKYNVYGAFIEKSIKLLKPEGQLIFIVPATFMILDEFKKLREFLSQNGATAIIYLGQNVFKPEADVSVVVLNFLKSQLLVHRMELFEYKNNKLQLVKVNSHWQGEIITFETSYTKELEAFCSFKIGDIYDIKISPRTPEVKKNPNIVVNINPVLEDHYLPLLNGQNLRCNEIVYFNYSGYWIKKTMVSKFRGYFSQPHVVVGLGFRKNGHVAAAYDRRCYPWMGDVYHLLRKNNLFGLNFRMTEEDVVEYLNSEYVKKYIKDTFKEITYHLSKTQLKLLPLPNKTEWDDIKKWNL